MNADETAFVIFISIAGGLAIVATVVWGVISITRLAMHHRERMARIGMGLNPDGPEPPPGTSPQLDNSSISRSASETVDRFATNRAPSSRNS
jgi:hypothetical protein